MQPRADRARRRTSASRWSRTNDCHYLHAEDARAHEVLLCIQTGKTFNDEKRWKFDTDQLYVKDATRMLAKPSPTSPRRSSNTLDIAKRCDLEFKNHDYQFPVYQADPGETLEQRLDRGTRRPGSAARLRLRHQGADHRDATTAVRGPPRVRARDINKHGLRRLLPDRRRLHQLGEGSGHPGRPGPRLGGRLPGRVRAPHHRPRPDAVQAPLRALPESRAQVDARYRRRLLLRSAATR